MFLFKRTGKGFWKRLTVVWGNGSGCSLNYHIGGTLIINNLVASALWHKFACMDPPVGLIESIQREVVNFFWDKLHWVPQAILFLSKDDGQGLINLACRRDTFRVAVHPATAHSFKYSGLETTGSWHSA